MVTEKILAIIDKTLNDLWKIRSPGMDECFQGRVKGEKEQKGYHGIMLSRKNNAVEDTQTLSQNKSLSLI